MGFAQADRARVPQSHRAHSFIERALDRIPVGTKGGEELAELMGKAQHVYQTIVEVQQDIKRVTIRSPQRAINLPCLLFSSSANDTAYCFMRNAIVTGDFSERFARINAC